MSIRVVIADDHQILVAALRTMLASEGDIAVVGEAGDGAALLDLVADTVPDVVIMDIGMPGMNGIEATQHLSTERPEIRVIVLSGYSDKRFVLEALNAGAAGYVIKASAADELPRAIRAVTQGKTYLCPEVASAVVDLARSKQRPAVRGSPTHLAPRERVVVRLIAEGKTSSEIAAQLHIAPSTVEVHRRNIMRKLGLHNIAEITRYAIREGLTAA